jgi:hypothetical protein
VSKVNPTCSALLYSTYLGGTSDDIGFGLRVDGSGNVFVTGFTASTDFPTTPGAFRTTLGGGFADAFVSELNGPGSALVYSTYLGGSGHDIGLGVAVDASGNAYVTGGMGSPDFPTTPGAFQTAFGGKGNAFVVKISPSNVPGVALAPWSLTFGPQAVGSTSPAQNVRLWDTSTQALPIISIVASGDFAQSNDCGATVQPSVPCTISVTFKPTATGTRSGVITITDNAAGSPQKVSLTGTGGGQPVVSLTPASLTFASQQVGTTSPAQLATLKNTGSAILDITSITVTGDFTEKNNCGSSVNPGSSCTLSVTFTPNATGTRTGAITIIDDATGSPHMLRLAGTGTTSGGPAVSLAPARLTFAPQPMETFSPPQLGTLRNIGSGPLTIISIGRSGDFYEGNNCPSTLGPGASCTLSVKFTPTSAGTRLGTVTIRDNAPGSPHKLPLSGTGSGTGSIMLKLSPASLSFGSVAVGATSPSQRVTLTNTGTVAASFLEPFGFATSGTDWRDFHKQPHCGTSLAPGKTCTMSVFFKPLATGTRTGFFLVRQGAASKQIPLSGTGTP